MTSAQTDSALIERLQAGDDTAVAELARDYGAKMYQLALRYTRNKEDAEEVVQDVLLKVRDKIDAFRGDAALSSWIYRITFNTAMSRLRATRSHGADLAADSAVSRQPDSAEAATVPHEVADWSALADDAVMRAQLRRRLVRALRDLPVIYRLPVLLRDVQGLSTEEASAVLRVKDQTLKSRLHRGRLFLRDRLSEFADGLSLHQH